MAEKAKLHVANPSMPILVAKEPGFRKFVGRGFVVTIDEQSVRISPFDEMENVVVGDSGAEKNARGYRLECQIITDWAGAVKLRDLLSHHIVQFEKRNGPIRLSETKPLGGERTSTES